MYTFEVITRERVISMSTENLQNFEQAYRFAHVLRLRLVHKYGFSFWFEIYIYQMMPVYFPNTFQKSEIT